MAMNDPWDEFSDASATSPQGATPLRQIRPAQPKQVAPQTPEQVRKDQLDVAQGEIDLAAAPQKRVNEHLEGAIKLRNAYGGEKIVGDYRTAIGALGAALRRPADATGDNALIYDYAKAMDPGSVVRESEMDMAASGAPKLDAYAAQLKKQFNIDGGGQLPPEIRRNLRREIANKAMALNQAYTLQRERYAEDARRNGFDPAEIIGPHDGDAYIEQIRAFSDATAPRQASASGPAAAQEGPEQGEDIDPETGKPYAVQDIEFPVEGSLTPEEEAEVARLVQNTSQGGSAVAGLGDSGSLGWMDEAGSAVEAVGQSLSGKGAFGDNYESRLRVNRAYLAELAKRDPLTYGAGQVAGGLALPGFGARGVGQMATVGAGYGAAYGAGSGKGAAESAAGAIVGGALGGGVGAGAGALFNGLGRWAANRAPSAARQEAAATMAAADRLGIDPMPADVGGATTRRLTGAAAQGPVSAAPIVQRAQQVTAQARAARDRIAADIGRVAEMEQAGTTARAGAQAFIQRTSQRGRTLYNQAQALAGETEVPLTNATQALDRHIAELSEVPGGAAGLDALRNLRAEIGDGTFTVAGVRGMRSALRDRFTEQGLRGSDLERRVNEVVDAAGDDIVTGLTSQGLENASHAYQVADRYWRMRIDTIDNTLAPIIGANGDKSGEQVMTALNTAAKSDNVRLARFMRTLNGEEQSTVRATLISQLGRSSNGAQNDAGTAFSLPQFLTHWNAMTPGAKRTLFDGEARAALDDLARVADGSKQAQRYANHSNSGGAMAGQMAVAGAAGWLGNVPGFIASMGAQYGMGRLLASPRFARWLARVPAQGANPAYIDRLQRIAAAEPAIASEVTGIRQALLKAANDNAGSAAAASDRQNYQADQR